MSDKIRKLKNSVVLTGKIAELEVKRGVSATNKTNYVSIKGAIQFGEQPVYTRRFDTYQLEYSIDKETKERKNNKLYPRVMEFLGTFNERDQFVFNRSIFTRCYSL